MLRDEYDARGSTCPDAGTLASFTAGRLDGEKKAEIEHHVMFCKECRRALFSSKSEQER